MIEYLLAYTGLCTAGCIFLFWRWMACRKTITETEALSEHWKKGCREWRELAGRLQEQRDIGLSAGSDAVLLYGQASDAALAESVPAADSPAQGSS